MSGQTELVLGIDLGIASCGWAVISRSDGVGVIVACGVRCWEAPEIPKTQEPKNQERRRNRGQRRVIRRRRQRMASLRRLFHEYRLLSNSEKTALRIVGLDPWSLRLEALDRVLSGQELAVALGHIARHRGFRSNSKRDRGANAASDTPKMLKALDATRERLSRYRTVGEMMAHDPAFAERKRNRDGDYSRSTLRADLEYEAGQIFAKQRAFGNELATENLEQAFRGIAFTQRPLADSWDKVGTCPFEPIERRTAKHAYSFELFRFLARLTSLRVGNGRNYRALTEAEIRRAANDFGNTKGMTFARLRKVCSIGEERFQGVPPADENNRDAIARSGSAAEGLVTLKNIVGNVAWLDLMRRTETLDRVAEILAFYESAESIRGELQKLTLEPLVLDAIMRGVADGAFAKFRGAGHISARAARNIIPHFSRGLTYDKACAEAGYRHTDRIETEITNPVARKALLEAEKQIRAIAQQYGTPDKIHIELARDIGKSAEERAEIERGIERRNKEKDKLRDIEFPETVGRPPQGREEFLRFELWKEQAGRCAYSDEIIHPSQISRSDNSVQVDHILPWSRFGDDSFHNRALCLARENQHKQDRTPFEWFAADKTENEWERFRARIETSKLLRGMKKRNYLLQNADEVEERFKTRNLNDTRYATRALMQRLESKYPAEPGRRRVFARPGTLTGKLRRAWAVNDLKKDPTTGKRSDDDRHHALDAIVVAATSESTLQALTRAFQEAEKRGLAREFGKFDPPWSTFLDDVRKAFDGIMVSRAERRRARGKAHDATIKQVREVDGKSVVYERKPVDKLTEADLERIPVPEPHERAADPAKLRDATVAALREWIRAGKPKDRPPRSPRGDVIRKIRVATTDKVAVEIREGTADRGDMVRVDVFAKSNAKGKRQFFLVPVYPHEVAMRETPPNRAVQGGGDDSNWPVVDETFEFLWSIYPMSLIEVTKSDGEVIKGYHRSLDRNTGALTVSAVNNSTSIKKGIGARTLLNFRKLTIDRLGREAEVPRERRTWRGKACT
ncbi:MAG TPA: type II CRISPR RNA-guided endonuclease Cas9 [Hyphomicrobium sp.]|nr:type II CRISPR RNA-guided endonuclease Cas9 [Hyphomicrobium sp.]